MILVTGASGLLGSHLLLTLLSEESKVRALIRSEEAKKKIKKIFSCYHSDVDLLMSKIDWVYGDVTNRSTLEKAFEGIKNVYHCAAYVSFSQAAHEKMKAVNVGGTEAVVDLCLQYRVDKLLHVSSIAAIGKPGLCKVITEECAYPTGILSAYAETKTDSEKRVWQGIEKGLNAVIINPSVILGPGDLHSSSGKITKQAAQKVLFYTKGITGFVDVRDVARAMKLLMNSEIRSERFILNAWNKSYQELFTKLSVALGKKAPKVYAPPWLTELVWRVSLLVSKLRGVEPNLTKASARAAHRVQNYSSEKLTEAINFTYCTFDASIQHIASHYSKFNG